MFTDATPEDDQSKSSMSGPNSLEAAPQFLSGPDKNTPREIYEEIFIERSIERGERPMTVGQSAEVPAVKLAPIGAASPRPLRTQVLDMKHAAGRDPRRPSRTSRPGGVNVNRDEFLQDPDSYNLAPEDSFASADSEGALASPRSTDYMTDRANSPSVASITSVQSVSSQVSTTGRRFLEWGNNSYCLFELYSLCLLFGDELVFFPTQKIRRKNLEYFREPCILEATRISKFRPPLPIVGKIFLCVYYMF